MAVNCAASRAYLPCFVHGQQPRAHGTASISASVDEQLTLRLA